MTDAGRGLAVKWFFCRKLRADLEVAAGRQSSGRFSQLDRARRTPQSDSEFAGLLLDFAELAVHSPVESSVVGRI